MEPQCLPRQLRKKRRRRPRSPRKLWRLRTNQEMGYVEQHPEGSQGLASKLAWTGVGTLWPKPALCSPFLPALLTAECVCSILQDSDGAKKKKKKKKIKEVVSE